MNETTNRPVLVAPRGVPARSKSPATVGELLNREDDTVKRLKSVATKYLPPDRALRLGIQAVRRTPELALCSPTSFMGALMSATGLGLEPNTPLHQAVLIPYKQKRPKRGDNGQIMTENGGKWIWEEYYECNFQIEYRGYVSLFYRCSEVKEVNADAVRAGDHFKEMKGTRTFLEYSKNLIDEPGDLIAAFCHIGLKDEGQAYTVLRRADVLRLRAKSQTYTSLVAAVDHAGNDKERKKAEAKLSDTPWVSAEEAMWRKSAIRQHASIANLSSEIAVATAIDGLSDAGRLDMSVMAEPDSAKAVFDGDYEVTATPDDDFDTETGEIIEQPKTSTTQQGGQSSQQDVGEAEAKKRGRRTNAQIEADRLAALQSEKKDAPRQQEEPPNMGDAPAIADQRQAPMAHIETRQPEPAVQQQRERPKLSDF